MVEGVGYLLEDKVPKGNIGLCRHSAVGPFSNVRKVSAPNTPARVQRTAIQLVLVVD